MKRFVFSDIHGHGALFDKVYQWLCNLPEPWECYFLGDACDRCDDGYRIITTLLSDHRFIYLKGNHEDLFVRAARALRKRWEEEDIHLDEVAANPYEFIIDYMWDWDVGLHIQNCGLQTLMDLPFDTYLPLLPNQVEHVQELSGFYRPNRYLQEPPDEVLDGNTMLDWCFRML